MVLRLLIYQNEILLQWKRCKTKAKVQKGFQNAYINRIMCINYIKREIDMKKIEAIIRKTKFEDVKEALLAADIEWFSYYDVRGEGKMRQARIYRGVMYDTSSIERVLLNIVVRDKNVEKTIQAVQKAACTGEIGDGRIFVIPVEDTVRIRTGERGDIALYNAEKEK